MRFRNGIMQFSVIMILTGFIMFVTTGNSVAGNIQETMTIIKEELIYPRECRYIIPAVIPSKEHDVRKNEEFLTVAKKLESMGIVKLTQNNGINRIVPDENNYDVVQQNVNMNYELVSVNLVMGTWDIIVTEVKTAASKTIAIGQKFLKTTRLYKPVTSVLDDEQRKLYSDTPMEWEISMEKGSPEVKEKPVIRK
ncbi:MAG: hypothetical protein HQK96_14585 [Nitrospirae bacterium]|nr:hypothetical protein [Nitrospirota bacterium]